MGLSTFLLITSTVDAAIKFRNPLSVIGNPVVNYYKDDNKTVGAVQDYKCGSRSYDQHAGTDFNAPLDTQVYSAALGGAYQTYDLCATYGSLSNTCGPGSYGNQVRIDHEGPNYYDGRGMTSIYAHLEKGTVIGPSSLLCAAKIGKSGSSGKSDGPHLHFEVRADGAYPSTSIDPFAGSCSQSTSYWTSVSGGVPGTYCQ